MFMLVLCLIFFDGQQMNEVHWNVSNLTEEQCKELLEHTEPALMAGRLQGKASAECIKNGSPT